MANISTLTLGFDEFSGTHNDERHLAKSIKSFGAKSHHQHILSKDEFLFDLENFFEFMDQPTIDGVNSFFVSKYASQQGWKIIFRCWS